MLAPCCAPSPSLRSASATRSAMPSPTRFASCRESGLPNETNAMFTNVEGEWGEVMARAEAMRRHRRRRRTAGQRRREDRLPARRRRHAAREGRDGRASPQRRLSAGDDRADARVELGVGAREGRDGARRERRSDGRARPGPARSARSHRPGSDRARSRASATSPSVATPEPVLVADDRRRLSSRICTRVGPRPRTSPSPRVGDGDHERFEPARCRGLPTRPRRQPAGRDRASSSGRRTPSVREARARARVALRRHPTVGGGDAVDR